MSSTRSQRTIVRPVSVKGRGYWSGQEVRVEFRPAPVGTGLSFVRDDLHGAGQAHASIPIHVGLRQSASRRTVLANSAGAEVAMIEHVAAALAGLGVDNCEIGVTGPEMPGCDGSAAFFVDAIDKVGLRNQNAEHRPLVVQRPVRCGDDDCWIEARPPLDGSLTIEYRLDYGPGSSIGRQWLMAEIDERTFRYEIAPARTFVLRSEADAMVAQGLGAHVTPQDLLIFRDDPQTADESGPIENVLRYDDECVRHKVLDVIGDLALAGRSIVGHVVACCSGHRLNADLVEALLATHTLPDAHRRSA